MYSDPVDQVLSDAGAEPGDTISVTLQDGATHQGVLMPRARQGNSDAVVLKLDSGYNIGIERSKIQDIAVEQKKEESREREPVEQSEKDLAIAVLHTGGTIASRVSYEEGGVKPAFEAKDLLEMYPELFEMAHIETEVVAQMLSEDMEPEHWQQIAETVASYREKDGVIIGHGTDTMHFTAAALSFMLENIDIPVVLVGAQRSSDRPSSDAGMNLVCATEFIKEQQPGVYICMHSHVSDTEAAIHRGTRARKMHTSRRDAFRTIGGKPFATVDYETREVSIQGGNRGSDGGFQLRTALDSNVGLLKTVPGLETGILDAYRSKNGVVVEGTGLGHMPVNSFDEWTADHDDMLQMLDAFSQDSIVVMTSQCLYGTVNMNVYDGGVKLQEADVVSAGEMLPETAYVKLMWCLGQTDSRKEAIDLFTRDIAGEHRRRREFDER